MIKDMCDRLDAFGKRLVKLEDRARADAEEKERQRQFAEEPLTLPPDISEYQSRTPPAKIGDDTHQPGGELHSVAAKSELPEPPLETEGDEVGDLPKELEVPVAPIPEPKGNVYPQPTAISLNEE